MTHIPEDLVANPICLDAIVRARAERAAGATALGGLAPAEFDKGLGWDEIAILAGRAAAYLEEREIGPGDRVAIWGQTSLAWAVWLVASAWRGAARRWSPSIPTSARTI